MNLLTGMKRRWFLFLFVWWGVFSATAQQQTLPQFPHAPGAYPGRIVLAADGAHQWEYRFIGTAATPHTSFFLPLDGPVILDTPLGTRSTYRLQFRTSDTHDITDPVTYVVDRSPPPVPQPEIAPGVYAEPITVRPQRPIDSSGDVTSLQYLLRVNGRSMEDPVTFRPLNDEDGLELTGQAGRVVDYVVIIYATDTVGNRSGIGRWIYRIDRRDEPFSGRPVILSPVDGTFSNPQLLLVHPQGLRDISVELTGPDGPRTAPYDGEMVVDGAGEFSVTVHGVRRDTGESVRETVTWTQGASHADRLPPSGRYNEAVTVLPGGIDETVRYRLDDTTVRRTDDLLLQRLQFPPDIDATRLVTIRTRSFADEDERSGETLQTRNVYLLDGRQAPPPDIATHDRRMILFSLSGTEISYRVQTTLGDEGDADAVSDRPDSEMPFLRYTDPVLFADLPAGATTILARARFPGAGWGAVARLDLQNSRDGKSAAGVPPVQDAVVRGQTVVVTSETDTPFVLGEAESREEDTTGILPVVEARGTSRFEWTIPVGFRTTLRIGTAGPDDSGRAVFVDNAPPAPPVIVVSRNRFRFDTSAQTEVQYRIDSRPFQTYEDGWIRLSGEPEARIDRRIEAYGIAGDRISPRTIRTVVLDARPVVIPPFESEIAATAAEEHNSGAIPVDGEIITGKTPYTLTFANAHEDLSIYYESAVGELPPLPTDASSRTTRELTLEGIANGERTVYLRLRGRFEGRETWSPIRTYRVILDQEPPAPPVLVAPESEVETNESRISIAFADPEEPGVRIWYRTRGDERFQRYLGRFDVLRDAADGAETVLVEAFSEDRAGNRTYLSPPRKIIFRETGVPRPLFTLNGRAIRDTYLLTTRESVVGVSSGNDEADSHTTMWRFYPLDAPAPPRFEPFDAPTVAQLDDEMRSFVGEAYRVDRAGQRSVVTRLILRVDPFDTAAVNQPEVLRDDDGRSGTLFWSGARDRDIYVSQPHLTGGFERVEETVSWLVPDDLPRITVLYFVVDEFGRRSETQTLHIDARTPPTPPSFVGVEDGAVYTGTQTVHIEADGPVRYTITTDGSQPPAIHPLSTIYENPIELFAAPGEDRTYRIRAQRTDSSGEGEGENPAEAMLTIRIDRNRPAAPQLIDVGSGSFFSEATGLAFRLTEDAAVYYRLTGGTDTRNDRYRQYNDRTDIWIDAEPGELRSYVLEAYAVDGAGNRSQTVSTWELFVDREIVYVDSARPGAGRGTRDEPFSDINDALRVVRDGGRRTVFLAGGTHRVAPALLRNAITTTGTITISGGYVGETWDSNGEETILEVDPVESISVAGDIRLQRLTFGGSVGEISVRDGNLTIENSDLSTPNQMQPRITVQDGTVNLHSVLLPEVILERVSGPDGSSAELTAGVFGRIEVTGGDILITDSTVGGLHLRESATVLMSDSAITFGTEDAPGVPVPLVTVTESTLQLRRSTVGALKRIDPVILVRATDASIDIADSYLFGAGKDLLYGITARRSRVTVQRSYLGLFGGTEQSGIVSGASSIHISDSMVVNSVPDGVPARAFHVTAEGYPTPQLQRVLLLRERAGNERTTTARSTSAITRQARADNDRVNAAAVRLVNDAFVDSRDVTILGWDSFIDRGRSAGSWEPDVAERRDSVRTPADRSIIDPLFLTPSRDAISDHDARLDIVQRVGETLSRLSATGD